MWNFSRPVVVCTCCLHPWVLDLALVKKRMREQKQTDSTTGSVVLPASTVVHHLHRPRDQGGLSFVHSFELSSRGLVWIKDVGRWCKPDRGAIVGQYHAAKRITTEA